MNDKTTSTGMLSRFAGLMLLSLSIGACSISMFSEKLPPQPCPPVSTLNDAAKITRFIEGPGRDLIDIDFTAEITNLSGKCFFELDSDTGEGLVRVNVKTQFTVERGAGNRDHTASFEYFISILDDQGKILDKQTFPYLGKYWKNKQFLKDPDTPIELTIPLSDGQIGQDFNVYVGFQLSREELEYNRGN